MSQVPLNVLLVETVAAQLQTVADYLKRQGCNVHAAPDGHQALGYTAQWGQHYELVLTDLGGYQGQQALEYLKHLRAGTPRGMCVLCSNLGEIDQATSDGLRYLGIARYLYKPLDLGDLQELVDGLARSRTATGMTGQQSISGSAATLSGRVSRLQRGGGGGAGDETPFFGTSRISEGSGSHSRLTPVRPAPTSTPSRGSARMSGDQDHGTRPFSARYEQRPKNPGTTRIRRSVTGRIENPNAAAAAPEQVACQHCGKQFAALRKPQAYTLPCIHCGQLNQIAAKG